MPPAFFLARRGGDLGGGFSALLGCPQRRLESLLGDAMPALAVRFEAVALGPDALDLGSGLGSLALECLDQYLLHGRFAGQHRAHATKLGLRLLDLVFEMFDVMFEDADSRTLLVHSIRRRLSRRGGRAFSK
jgi:hypothetical protein